MPRYQTTNKDGEAVERYNWPAQYVSCFDEAEDLLRSWRSQAAKDQQEFLGYQKFCGREDPQMARFFKEAAGRELKRQRACTLILPFFGRPDRNQEVIGSDLWPVDLAHELDEISYRLTFSEVL